MVDSVRKYVHYDLPRSDRYMVILVYPYNDYEWGKYQKGIRHTYFMAYSPVKEFYHTDHSRAIPGDVDYRRTLFWEPSVKTDTNGKAKVDFYNNSTARNIIISAEGITKEGIPVILRDENK